MRAFAAGLLLAFLMLAGCSDTDDGGEAMPTTSSTSSMTAAADAVALSIATSGAYPVNPGFDPSTLSVPAGAKVTVTFSNADPLPVTHNIVFEKMGSSDSIGSGDQTTVELTAPSEPGELLFFCSIGDHRDRGMEGTLTVTA
jgi:plastocyanin